MKLRRGSATHPVKDEDIVCSCGNIRIKRTKNRDFGEIGLIECDFDPTNRRIFQKGIGDRTVYSWDHNGIQLPEYPAADLDEFRLQSNPPQPF